MTVGRMLPISTDDEAEPEAEITDEVKKAEQADDKLKQTMDRAKKALRAWRLLTIDWRAYCTELGTETTFKSPEDIDLMELLHITWYTLETSEYH